MQSPESEHRLSLRYRKVFCVPTFLIASGILTVSLLFINLLEGKNLYLSKSSFSVEFWSKDALHLQGGYQVCTTSNRSETCKSVYGNQSKFLDPRTGLNTQEVTVDFQNYTHVTDLRCRFVFRYAYFHIWHNCILEMIPLLYFANTLPERENIIILERYLKNILDKTGLLTKKTLHIIESSQRDSALIVYCKRMFSYDASISLEWKMELLRTYFISKDLRNRRRVENILYLKRIGHGREIYPEHYLLGNISYSFPNHTLTIFNGNEGLNNTIHLFWSASIIVGGHGAGIINAIFSHPSALLIEITRRDPRSGKLWRSNLYPEVTNSVRCACTIIVSTTAALYHQNISLSKIENVIKPLIFVLQPQDILAVISQISRFVQATTQSDILWSRDQICHLNNSVDYSGI